MLRVACFTFLVLAGCHHEPAPVHPTPGDLPPLPPASGTPVGYLVDNASPLKLRDDQLKTLKDIDTSLAARDDEIDTQLRLIERPDEDPPAEKGKPMPRHNNAPGAQIRTTADAGKLHEARKSNDFDALQKAFAILDPDQQATARKLLEERGVSAPGSAAKKPEHSADDGVPVEP